MNKLKAKNTLYNDPMYDVVVDSRMLEQHLKEKDHQITDLQSQLTITQKALELAVVDKCKFENALLSTSLGIAGGKVAVPKKEQWYLEQAEKEV